MAILGAMEMIENRDQMNWMIPSRILEGIGGAMDLLPCADSAFR